MIETRLALDEPFTNKLFIFANVSFLKTISNTRVEQNT